MSALGQKQTLAVQNVMFALPPRPDMNPLLRPIGFVAARTLQIIKPSPSERCTGQWQRGGTKSNTPQENYFARKRTKREMSPGHSG